MLSAFYGAFSPACFALLGLWLVAIQLRLPEWRGSRFQLRRSYGVALHFVLPGIMSLGALIDPHNPVFWRVCFGVVALGGVVVLLAVGISPRPRPASAGLRSAGQPDDGGAGTISSPAGALAGRLERVPFAIAIALYLAVGILALVGGVTIARVEAILLIALVFTGFNGGWLILFDEVRDEASAAPSATAAVRPAATSPPDAASALPTEAS